MVNNSNVELFAHFGLELGMVLEGITCLSFQFQMTKKEEKYAYSKWIEQAPRLNNFLFAL